ncbi:MAG: HAMP domain-containing histidine kinase [Oscillospiraceae bacterium]|nr:HAMP domain-containing histidine kinase [Oscillospiraceae bacterium]
MRRHGKTGADGAPRVKRAALSRGLRRRWVRGSVFIVAAALGVVVFAFSVFFYNYYYSTVSTGLEEKAKTATDFFSNYVAKSYAEYYDSAFRYTETFADGDRLELQFMDTSGRVVISSLGVTAGTQASSPEVKQAVQSGLITVWVGRRASTNERIMAVSAPIVYTDGQVIGVMRYITSLASVDMQVTMSILAVSGAGVSVLLVVLTITLLFIRSVIAPVGEITQMSRRIADGSYGIQIENTFKDEMGEMVDSINEMSMKIAQAERIKTEFISSISHELRTPLTAITGWGETLVYNEKLDEDTSGGIAIILKEARRLTKMVEELLEFTRMEDGRFTLNIESVDLAAELEDAIFTYRELFHHDALDLRYRPAPDDMPMLPGDPNRLKQVFLNIFDNAAKYGSEGGRIDVSVETRGDFAAVSIRDFGPGAPEDELENLKMKFYKGSNSKARGSGIGLAVCDEIIRYHGGKLELENAEGGGLRVTVWLPLTSAATLGAML